VTYLLLYKVASQRAMSGTKIYYVRPESTVIDSLDLQRPGKGFCGYAMTITKPKLNGTQLIHGDSIHPVPGGEVAPSISVTTSAFVDSLSMERKN
jgi:hypothetical protein